MNSRFAVFSFLAALLLSVTVVANDPAVWRPVTQAELDMDKPVVEPDADAEAIFWEVRLDDKSRKKLYTQHYVRVKIFTERGREKFAKFTIPYSKGLKIENVAARVIKPDGTIVNLPQSSIFDRELITARKLKIRAKSFAVPGIEPGVIVEYQYRERFKGDSLTGERLVFQRDIPMQRATYYVRPYKNSNLNPTFFNMSKTTLVRDTVDDSFLVATMKNVPAFKEEPYMAPVDAVRPWALLKYDSWSSGWHFFGRGLGLYFEKVTRPDKSIKSTAQTILAGSATNEDKVRRIYDYVQTEIKNLSFDRTGASNSKKVKIKEAKDVLKKRMGYASHVDLLFASLVRAAGLEATLVMSGDRSEIFFNPRTYPAFESFLHPAGVGVLIDGKRRFFNPGTPYLPFGRLLWYEENVHALLMFNGAYKWSTIPISKHKDSTVLRKGKFELDADGNLTGTAEKTYTGHSAIDQRRVEYMETDAERTDHFKEEIQNKVSTAEVSDISIREFFDPKKPLRKSYKLKIPGYGQKTGSRIFFQPGVFEYNSKPVFSSAERLHPIYFDYPWSEFDEIEIKLPDGFVLENYGLPENIVEKKKIAGSEYSLDYDKETHTLKYKRDFFVGGNGQIYFQQNAYTALKRLFDLFHKSDTHTLALKRAQP